MIEGMQEGLEEIKLKKCSYFIGEPNAPKIEYMGSGARIFGDGVGALNIYVMKATRVNIDELKEKVSEVITEYGFEITSTEVSSVISEASHHFRFFIKYKEDKK